MAQAAGIEMSVEDVDVESELPWRTTTKRETLVEAGS